MIETSRLQGRLLMVGLAGLLLAGCAGATNTANLTPEERVQIACKADAYGQKCRYAKSLAGDYPTFIRGRNR